MSDTAYTKEYFDGKQRRGVLTLSNEAFLDYVFRDLRLREKKPMYGIDIGCAYGSLAQAMHERGVLYMSGIDVSEYAITEGKKRYQDIDLDAFDIDNNDTPDAYLGRYDVMVSLHTFEHCANPLNALRRASRMLKDDGVFFMIVPNPRIWVGRVLRIFGQEKRIPVFGDETHVSLFTRKQWLGVLHDADFVVEESLGRPFYTLKYEWVYALLRNHVYVNFLRESGFELLFVCTKKK